MAKQTRKVKKLSPEKEEQIQKLKEAIRELKEKDTYKYFYRKVREATIRIMKSDKEDSEKIKELSLTLKSIMENVL